MKEPLVSRILKYSLYAVFLFGVIFALTLPWMLDRYFIILYDAYSVYPGYRTFIMAFLISVSIPCLWIVIEMVRMLNSIPKEPFVMRNVRALNRIGVIFLVLAAAFFGKCLLYITIMTLFCGFLFIGAGLFAFTLAALIRQAANYREENDLTI